MSPGIVSDKTCRYGRQDYGPASPWSGQPKKEVRGEARVQHVGGLRGGSGLLLR